MRRTPDWHPMGAFRSVSAQRVSVTREAPLYLPGRMELREAEYQQQEMIRMVGDIARAAGGARETFFFAGTARHMDMLRERKPFEFAGRWGAWVGSGLPLSDSPDTPILPDAQYEARVEFPAGVMQVLARQLVIDGRMVWLLKQGASLFAEGVVIGAIRELKPAKAER